MKQVLSGNEAIARAAYDSGVSLVSSYPGTPSTEITEYASKYPEIYVEWATNEKVAFETALGASLAGVRALTCMKHVGVNVAADPMMTASYTGADGSLVLLAADDPNMFSSQNEQDSRHYARMSRLPMLEPANSQEAYDYIRTAFAISEERKTPVIVRSVTRVSHSSSAVEIAEREERKAPAFTKDPLRWVMAPANARARKRVIEKRLRELAELSAEFIHVYNEEADEAVISSGVASEYAREALPDKAVIKLGMVWPLPSKRLKELTKSYKKLYIVEEGDNFLETELKAAGLAADSLNREPIGELSVESVASLFGKFLPAANYEVAPPPRPPNMCAGCSHRGLYYAINRLKLTAIGDIGCYTLGYMPPLQALDSCVCMGASVSMAHGFDRGSKGEYAKKSVAVIGDSTFLHTGVNGLINSVYNGGASTIILLDNRITGMTGHQPNPASGKSIYGAPAPKLDLEALCRAIGVRHVRVVDPFEPEECVSVLREETAREEVSVIITNRPCIFADKNAIKPPYKVLRENCSGCKACVRIGCPAILWTPVGKKGLASITSDDCTGCGLCVKLCKFAAIVALEQN